MENSTTVSNPSGSVQTSDLTSVMTRDLNGDPDRPREDAGFKNSGRDTFSAANNPLDETDAGNAIVSGGCDVVGSVVPGNHVINNHGSSDGNVNHVRKLESLVDSLSKLAERNRLRTTSAWSNLAFASHMNLGHFNDIRPNNSIGCGALTDVQLYQGNDGGGGGGLPLSRASNAILNGRTTSGFLVGATEQPLDLSSKRQPSTFSETSQRERCSEHEGNVARRSIWSETASNRQFQEHFGEPEQDSIWFSSSSVAFQRTSQSRFRTNWEESPTSTSTQCYSDKRLGPECGRGDRKRKRFNLAKQKETEVGKKKIKSTQLYSTKLNQSKMSPHGTLAATSDRTTDNRSPRRSDKDPHCRDRSEELPASLDTITEEVLKQPERKDGDWRRRGRKGKALTTMTDCSCGEGFASLYEMAIHLDRTGHVPRQLEPEHLEQLPKLVRGQDVWMMQGHEPADSVLRCVQCNASFRSLPDLTVHMIRTKHYVDIVGTESSSNGWKTIHDASEKSPGNQKYARKSRNSSDPAIRETPAAENSDSGAREVENRSSLRSRHQSRPRSSRSAAERSWSLSVFGQTETRDSSDSGEELGRRQALDRKHDAFFSGSMPEDVKIFDRRTSSSAFVAQPNLTWWPYAATKKKKNSRTAYSTTCDIDERQSPDDAICSMQKREDSSAPDEEPMKPLYGSPKHVKDEWHGVDDAVRTQAGTESVLRKSTSPGSAFRMELYRSSHSAAEGNREVTRVRKTKRTEYGIVKRSDYAKKTKKTEIDCGRDVYRISPKTSPGCETGRQIAEEKTSSPDSCRKRIHSGVSRCCIADPIGKEVNASGDVTTFQAESANTVTPQRMMDLAFSLPETIITSSTLTAMKNFVDRSFSDESFVRGHGLTTDRSSFLLRKYFDSNETGHGRLHGGSVGLHRRGLRAADISHREEEPGCRASFRVSEKTVRPLNVIGLRDADHCDLQLDSQLREGSQTPEMDSFDFRNRLRRQESPSLSVNVANPDDLDSHDEPLLRKVSCSSRGGLPDVNGSVSKDAVSSFEDEHTLRSTASLSRSTSAEPDRRSPTDLESAESEDHCERGEDHDEKRTSPFSCRSTKSASESPNRSPVGRSVDANVVPPEDAVPVRSANQKSLTKTIPYLLSTRSFEQVC